jgi:hypothetical protein
MQLQQIQLQQKFGFIINSTTSNSFVTNGTINATITNGTTTNLNTLNGI